MAEISVIIPTWNRAETLGKAISSALNQTLSPYEVLVCGVDGSPDQKVVNSINDPRVRWIEGGKDGLASIPRNIGIKASKGEWLAFLDSDDEWLPEKLEKQFKHATEIGCDASCTNAIRYIPSQEYTGEYVDDIFEDQISFPLLLKDNCIICSSVLVKKELVEKSNYFPEDPKLKVGEDYALWLRIATLTNFAFVNEPLLIYRDDPQNSIRAFCLPYWDLKANVLKSFISWAENESVDKVNRKYLGLAKKFLLYVYIKKLLHNLMRR
ncbi:MAG: glycosyltransferase family 2 protein [Methanosarcina flavescens]|jgi:teichuronic acid biosynthesis glycosyltransferase TuaG|uniref:Glycosyltransferase n=1 Tax=Methanosarcina flavescens TaxID=1715806 RepID=A0A660HQL2_9EURY|nr:glycosyltransferase [Methanosarcina flavescens]AYK14399.1 glycosyltransferase [Methanosarcina flavescens]NLK32567.1 glycosyltransferase [Methanosarcina flavescens]